MNKICLCLALLSVSAVTLAQPATTLEFFGVTSVQPGSVSDTQCRAAFTKIILPADNANFYSSTLDITNRASHHELMGKDLGYFVWTQTATMHVSQKALTSPMLITSVYVDRAHFVTAEKANTNEDDGTFTTYYCHGRVHKIS